MFNRPSSPSGSLPAGLVAFLALVLLGLGGGIPPAYSQDTPVASEPDARSMPPLGKGVFLVASPILMDPNFREAVILICEYGPEGTLGVIVNRPTDLPLSEALPTLAVLKGTSYVLFAGGPVQPGGILMLFRVGETSADLRPVMDGIYLGGDLHTLERVITQPQPTETFRAFAGYAGWAPGQLEMEIATGSWATVPADSASIFDKDPSDLWSDLLERLQAPGVVRSHESPDEPGFQGSASHSSEIVLRGSWE